MSTERIETIEAGAPYLYGRDLAICGGDRVVYALPPQQGGQELDVFSVYQLIVDGIVRGRGFNVLVGGREPGETREEARTSGPNRGRPPVPRPSKTPPMWADNPGRTRRTRNRATHARTPSI